MNDITENDTVAVIGRAETPTVQQDAISAMAAPEAYAQDMFSTLAGFELAQRMAGALSRATLLPQQFQGNVANCMVLLDIASRFKNMGISPFTVAQQLVVVHGRPAWMGQFVIAIINRSGLFAQGLQFQFDGEGDAYGCTAWTIRKDGERVSGVKITAAMVRSEKWDINPKWKNMPQQMYQYRAATFFGRAHCPELLMGYHTSDELEDLGVRRVGGSAARAVATSALLEAVKREKERKTV